MRFLALALVAVASLTFVSLTAEPAQAVGICADESGRNQNEDLYNNMGWSSRTDCDGIVCYAYTGGDWVTCVPPTIYCTTAAVPCQPPVILDPDPCSMLMCQPPFPETASTAIGPPALCVGTVYNNQAGQPSSGCDGVVCHGFSNGDWHTCVADCTTCLSASADSGQVALCTIGDVYNTGGSPCRGAVCVGWTQGGWVDCYPDFGPCWPTCPPPPPRFA